MSGSDWHLAQINIAPQFAHAGDPRVQPFVDALGRAAPPVDHGLCPWCLCNA
ncbi:MAG: hypothetical protein ABW039_03545 [Sphingobium sp.]